VASNNKELIMLKGKKIALGISGSIAAYKAADLTSRLIKAGAEVQCIMTAGACEFITPLTLQTLSGRPVMQAMFAEPRQWNVEHIAVSEWADLFLVAPATANVIGKFAQGIADDLLSAVIMAAKKPVVIAPAMNTAMYNNPAVQHNMKTLQERGYTFVEPEEGLLACGDIGKGRLAPLDDIIYIAEYQLESTKPLKGIKVLVTAGPTQESLDPVRFLTNHSSGKMGYAIAKIAWLMGAEVTLISGPVHLTPLPVYKLIPVVSAAEMAEAVFKEAPAAHIVIKTAAVADYTPLTTEAQKIKKKTGNLNIELARTTDILATLSRQKTAQQVLIGFAAETQDLLNQATDKLQRKNADLLVANDLTQEGAGFGSDTNIVTLLFADGTMQALPEMSKETVAEEILQHSVRLLRQKLSKV
jgi:phosphopantothenoylcysteine decarboxylase/phosphopantothenate--cysteine ligase